MSFLHPDLKKFGPVPFWFWNDRLDEKELRRQVRLMHGNGVHNFIIHARWGLETSYLSKQWWKLIKATVAEAKKLGSRAWLYDEYNYPSGIGGFHITKHAKFRERFLSVSIHSTKNGRSIHLPKVPGLPVAGFAYPLRQGKLIGAAAQALKGSTWNPPDKGEWKIYCFAMQVEPFEGSGRYSVNYLAPEPTKEFIRITHEAYAKHLGKDLGPFFLDEPRFNNPLPWDERLPQWFKKRKGYDLLPHLALLLHEGEGSAQVRQDYYGLLSDLYSENFFKPIGAWCKRHKVELTGHLMAEESLAGSTRYSAHALKPYKHFSIPGVDHLGKGMGGLAPKIVSSQAALQGKERVSCETFAGCGQDFGMDEMNAITHWLFSQGVNLIVPHAFFYAMRTARQKADWPPSMFYQWKHWPEYAGYSQRVARLAEALSGGKPVADTAVFHPTEAFHATYVPDLRFKTGYFAKGPKILGDSAKLETWFQKVGQGLQNSQRDFHVLGSADLKSLKRYKVLLLPFALDNAAIRAFKKAGGKVIVEINAAKALARHSKALKHEIKLSGPAGIKGKLFEERKTIHDPYLHVGLEKIFKKKAGGVVATHYRKPGEELYFVANLQKQAMKFKAQLGSQGKRVELRWPGTGQVETVQVKRVAAGSEVELSLPALESVLVAFVK